MSGICGQFTEPLHNCRGSVGFVERDGFVVRGDGIDL